MAVLGACAGNHGTPADGGSAPVPDGAPQMPGPPSGDGGSNGGSDGGSLLTDTGVPDPDAARASAACGAGPAVYLPGTAEGELVQGDTLRTFRIHVPPAHDAQTPLPLVLMFHGGGGSGRQFAEASSGMDAIADREGFIAVYPDGSGALRTWNGGGCCGYAVENQIDDVGFVAQLLDQLEGTLCVDRRRVYASGMSNGGIFAHRLACELAERITAIAPVAGTHNTEVCTPARPVPVLHIHGSADGHVPWQGGEGCGPAGVPFRSVPDTVEGWRVRNGCGTATAPYFMEGNGHCEAYTGCTARADVVLCTVEGGGHSWPGGAPSADIFPCPADGPQSATFRASEVAWSFFRDKRLP